MNAKEGAVIYDANCIIYRCFDTEVTLRRRRVRLRYLLLTQAVQDLTNRAVP
jgi:hypothetical protein